MPQSDSGNLRAQRLALLGLVTNLGLAAVKLIAGLVGNSYALVADAVESLADIAGSVIVWSGLHVSARPASEKHPYGYGKAEALAALAVGLIILGAGLGIAVEAVREIITPHHTPAWWTLVVLVAVVVIKEGLFRVGRRVARETDSTAAKADAWHHRADAITSVAALVGIGIAVVGKYKTGDDRFAPADDWAALLAAGLIVFNAVRLMLPPVRELLDVHERSITDKARAAAEGVPGVQRVQKAFARKSGTRYWIDMHIWVNGSMSVRDAHTLSHQVKDAVRHAEPRVVDVLIHIEPARESF